jgi:YggT family protein
LRQAEEAVVATGWMLFDAIDQVQLFVQVFGYVYLLAIFLHIILSWFRLPYSLSGVQRFLYDVCEPYLRLWRRLLPFSLGPVDLSPMIGFFVLIIGMQVLIAVLDLFH